MITGFEVTMSRGDKIQIDSDEMPKIIESIQLGSPCKVRRGLFNPSFYVSIGEDADRMSQFREQLRSTGRNNERDKKYNDGKDQIETPKLRPLKDIFEGVTMQIESGQPRISEK